MSLGFVVIRYGFGADEELALTAAFLYATIQTNVDEVREHVEAQIREQKLRP